MGEERGWKGERKRKRKWERKWERGEEKEGCRGEGDRKC